MNSYYIRTGFLVLITAICTYIVLTTFVLPSEQKGTATLLSGLSGSIIVVLQLVIGDVLGDVAKRILPFVDSKPGSDNIAERQEVTADGAVDGVVQQEETNAGDRNQITKVSLDDGEFEATQSRKHGGAAREVTKNQEKGEDNE